MNPQTERMHILYPNELSKYGRPIGKVDDDKLMAFITEAEDMYIKPVLGDGLFVELTKFGNQNNDDYKILLDGGIYTTAYGQSKVIQGLRCALSYFVYAQNIISGDFQSTRYGFVMKESDYSSHISSRERSDAYNNAIEVGHVYLSQCITYCKTKGIIRNSGMPTASGSIRIRKIGK